MEGNEIYSQDDPKTELEHRWPGGLQWLAFININSLLEAPLWPPPPLIAPLHWGIPKENKAPVASGGQRLLVHPTPLWGNAPENFDSSVAGAL